jgi:hypothetical protein
MAHNKPREFAGMEVQSASNTATAHPLLIPGSEMTIELRRCVRAISTVSAATLEKLFTVGASCDEDAFSLPWRRCRGTIATDMPCVDLITNSFCTSPAK